MVEGRGAGGRDRLCLFFFFKQKTAYEISVRDWSSDVCSSDLDQPRFPFAQFNLGLLHEEQGHLEEARSAYAAEVSAYPGHFKARFNLGKILFRLGDAAGSREQMREVIRLAPKQPEGYLFLARGLLQESAPVETVQE